MQAWSYGNTEIDNPNHRLHLKGSSAAALYKRARASAATACCGSILPRASLSRSARCSRTLFVARSAGEPRGDRPFAGFSGDVAALHQATAT